MFLSNPRKSLLLLGFCALLAQACGSSQTVVNNSVVLVPESESEFPFKTREPEVYQAEIVISSGGNSEERIFVAKKAAMWRIDLLREGKPWVTQLMTDNLYSIDHQRQVYGITGVQGPDIADRFNDLTSNYFKGKEYREFEELGRENDTIKYRVKASAVQKDEIILSFDTRLGMIVKQEFTSRKLEDGSETPASYAYEMRGLRTEVDDSVFAIPKGYRKISTEEYRRSRSGTDLTNDGHSAEKK